MVSVLVRVVIVIGVVLFVVGISVAFVVLTVVTGLLLLVAVANLGVDCLIMPKRCWLLVVG